MNINKIKIPISDTNYFSKIAVDYAQQDEKLAPFIQHFPSKESLQKQIEFKKNHPVNRIILHEVLEAQYQNIHLHSSVSKNLDLLLNDHTFTICTAHQPCIFTGPLYFIYKISHAIKLAKECKTYFPEYHFVPIFYLGSEDNDIEEIGSFFIGSKKYQWQTKQTGASGRMNTDDLQPICDELLNLLDANLDDEKWLMDLLREAYRSHRSLADATRILVNGLFKNHGLLIIDSDDKRLKCQFVEVINDELFNRNSSDIVRDTNIALSSNYKIQANGRGINLFYLVDNVRERIEVSGNAFRVLNTNLSFTMDEMEKEVNNHPHHFSPNVILRPLYQEMISPNIAFIGGGGEIAYWLELKRIFDFYKQPFPVIILRNSFLFIEQKIAVLIQKLGLPTEDIFLNREAILKKLISGKQQFSALLPLLENIQNIFMEIENLGKHISINLANSIKAHHAKSNRISDRVEQKFLAHIKRNEQELIAQVNQVVDNLFPANSLQERHDNFLPYFKKYGRKMIDMLVDSQEGIESSFIVLVEK